MTEEKQQETGKSTGSLSQDKQEAEPKPELSKPKQQKSGKPPAKDGKMAVIRIRNTTRAGGAVRDTLKMLRLYKKFTCAVVDNTPAMRGMLDKAKDFTTYGEIDEDTIKLLQQKRGTKDKEGKMKTYFHLHPPIGGFERKGIKHSFRQGGALGYRGARINDLIKKMI